MDIVQAKLNKAGRGERGVSLRMTLCGCPAAEGTGVRRDHSSPHLSTWGHISAPLESQPVGTLHGFSGSRTQDAKDGHLQRKLVPPSPEV